MGPSDTQRQLTIGRWDCITAHEAVSVRAAGVDGSAEGGFRCADWWMAAGSAGEWAEELLSERRLREEGFFDAAPIRRMWREHVSGQRRWQECLWEVLTFRAWLAEAKSVREAEAGLARSVVSA